MGDTAGIDAIRAVYEGEIVDESASKSVENIRPKQDEAGSMRECFARELVGMGADPKFLAGLFMSAMTCGDKDEMRVAAMRVDVAVKAMKYLDMDLSPKDQSMQKLIDAMLMKYNNTRGELGGR